MNRMRLINSGLVTLGLATAMHLDWHIARPAVHHLSLGWRWHGLLAVPVFGLTAWYVLGAWPRSVGVVSVAIIAVASSLAAVVEPAWEYASGASFGWTFGVTRLVPFGEFLATGVVVHAAAVGLMRRRRAPGRPHTGPVAG